MLNESVGLFSDDNETVMDKFFKMGKNYLPWKDN